MPLSRSARDEPLPGYRLIEPLGKGGFGEVWKCSAPGGLCKAIKFVEGNRELDHAGSNAEQELRAFELIRSIRHPFLLSIERVEFIQGDLVIVMELADKSLHDLLTECRDAGLPGVPRPEALGYLREAAEVLDLLNQEHGLKHLDVKPRNLFLVHNHVKVADFGLVGSLADLFPGARLARPFAGGLTPLYAAPETFLGQVTLFSDQYSLAVTYHELITGEALFKARNYNQLAMMATAQQPDLSALPDPERAVLVRALAKKPRDRFSSCVDFITALEDAVFSPPPPIPRPNTTSFDLPVVDALTPAPPRGSGLLRRRSRILPTIKPATSDPLAGYQLLESLGRGPSGELWRARGPGGGGFLVRFLTMADTHPALERLRGIRHPSLAGMSIVPAGPERTAIVSETGSMTLWDRFREVHATGQPGISRDELLGHLGRIADALDALYHQLQVQHLALSPRSIALCTGEPILLEFGLAELLWLPEGLSLAQLNPKYAACEMFEGLVSDASDQYSLAVMFQELLVGVHPFRNLNARQLASPRMRGQPDVGFLPSPDREVVLRALSPAPEQRFRSCGDFIIALEQAATAGGAVAPSAMIGPKTINPGWKEAVSELVLAACKGDVIRTDAALPYRYRQGDHIECRAWARLAPGMAKLKLAGFRDQWRAEKWVSSDGRFVYSIDAQTSLWDRCMGRSPALQAEVCIGPPDPQTALSPVRIHLMPVECPRSKADTILGETGPRVLSSLATYLGLLGHKTGQERYPLTQVVRVASCSREWQGQLRDISETALCVLLSEAAPCGPVTLTIQRWASPLPILVPGRIASLIATEAGFEVEISLG